MQKWQTLKKLNRKNASPLPLFKKTCPCTILPPPFFNFSDSPPHLWWRYLKFTLPPSKKKKGGGPNYDWLCCTTVLFQSNARSKWMFQLFNFYQNICNSKYILRQLTKSQNTYQFTSWLFKLSREKMFNNNTI